jgi:hypothetical protein
MVTLHNWLHNQLATANAAALEDANSLVVERNAVLGGLDLVGSPATFAGFDNQG